MPEPLTCGNSGFICSNIPGQILTVLPSNTPCLSGCRADVCCSYRAPECFQAGSGLLECPSPTTVRKMNPSPCTGQCDVQQCCEYTCLHESFVGCGPRPTKPDMGSIICSNQVCSQDTCCDNYCTTGDFRCPGQLEWRSNADTTRCPTSGCTTQLCCVPKTCETYTCPATSHKIVGAMCDVNGCRDELCCVKTCASYPCPDAYSPKNQDYECGDSCTTSTCCSKSCAGYSCCYPYVLKPTPETIPCTGECGNGLCCMPTCALYSCPFGMKSKADADHIQCTDKAATIGTSVGGTGYVCKSATCCESVCTTTTCDSAHKLKTGMLGQTCVGSCNSYCCEDKTCANQ